MIIFQLQFVVLFFVLIRSGDLAIGAAVARDIIRAVLYGIVAIFALIGLILSLGVH